MTKYYTDTGVSQILEQAIASTETMNNLDVDPDVIKARLKVIRELADGFGIDIKIPNNRSIMITRYILGMTA